MAEKPKTVAKAAPAKASAPAPKAAAAPALTPRKVIGGAKVKITAEERTRLICEAAYYRAEKRGFSPGGDFNDWVEAEKDIDSRFTTT